MSNKILVFGATSAIAVEAAKIWAQRGAEFFLVARSKEKLEIIASDLRTRGAKSTYLQVMDLSDKSRHIELFQNISSQLADFDTVLIAYGTLGDQKRAEEAFEETEKELNNNFLSVVSLLTRLANIFEKRGSGSLAVITSVAGDRGRKSNYVYGTAKGALSIFLSGLRNRLGKTGVVVLDIKPGFTDTPMTANIKKGPLFVSASIVGQGIVNAIDKKKEIVYLPWFWEIIMMIIRNIPEKIFKKLSL
ncbi:MAG: SDR family oxidoreductase [bacterium]|nr:SDR family oxidoreductase [bacterium]